MGKVPGGTGQALPEPCSAGWHSFLFAAAASTPGRRRLLVSENISFPPEYSDCLLVNE